jgi:mannose-1-phosphate guanylyltransferase / mannose-6-phosphate isomerase
MPVAILPVILSGGSGTRLWPLSRDEQPKQFHCVFGQDTLFEATVKRANAIAGAQRMAVVCNEEHRFMAAQQAAVNTDLPVDLILESVGRNTAPAIAAVAQLHLQDDPVMVVLSADHYLPDTPGFAAAVAKAVTLAQLGYLVTFGIKPSAPETGYGYIEAGERIAALLGASKVARFIEKPSAAAAAELIKNPRYTWNSGMFVMRASVYVRELALHAPQVHTACAQAVAQAAHSPDFIRLHAASFEACPNISVDYAVFEHSDSVATLAYEGVWSDLGTWGSVAQLAQLLPKADGASHATVVQVAANNNYVLADKPVVLVGVSGVSVVDTPDALLVVAHAHSQAVKDAVAMLKPAHPQLLKLHRKVQRPWGWYDCVDVGQGYQVKRITVKPGASLSLQSHAQRAEHWVVVKGKATITVGEAVADYLPNSHVSIPLGAKHRLQNHTDSPVELVEVQYGGYLGEDDIVRYADVYHRVTRAS